MESVTNIIRITSNPKLKMSPDGDFFETWVEFLKPVHKLTNKEMKVLALFLKERYELSQIITDPDKVDMFLMSLETKRKIIQKCGITPKYFQVIMSKFRKKGVITNGKIYLNLIPSITKDGVGLMVYFSFKNEQLVKLGPQANSKRA